MGKAAFGFLADYYGRKNIFIVSIIAMALTGNKKFYLKFPIHL
jgi:MFS family permease